VLGLMKVPTTVSSPDMSLLDQYERQLLRRVAREVRRDILLTTFAASSGHPGGSLSETEILVSLYSKILRHDPKRPDWADRDRFILSKGHATPGLYATLANKGYFSRSELQGFRKINSLLQGHSKIGIPGVEMSAGSLGQGLSFGVGVALACRLDKRSYRTYVLLGDGECDEGQVWEAAMSASHYKVDTLTAIIDRNRIQNDRFVSQVMEIEPLAAKWKGFGWNVVRAQGHSFLSLQRAFLRAQQIKGRPTVIIANTTKGKGVSFMEDNPDFHGKPPNAQQFLQAMEEIGYKGRKMLDEMRKFGFSEQVMNHVWDTRTV
jgi:transketolase